MLLHSILCLKTQQLLVKMFQVGIFHHQTILLQCLKIVVLTLIYRDGEHLDRQTLTCRICLKIIQYSIKIYQDGIQATLLI